MAADSASDHPGPRKDVFDLEEYRDKIVQLYVRQNVPLVTVIQILKQDGCFASRNMYLNKFKVWGIRKNSKRKDKVQRGARAKESKDDDPLAHEKDQSFGSKDENMTSFQTPSRRGPTASDVVLSSHTHNSGLRMPPTLTQPEIFQRLSRFLMATSDLQTWMQTYQLPAFESASLSVKQDAEKQCSLLVSEMTYGVRFLVEGHASLASTRIERAFQTIEHIIRNPHPAFLSGIFCALCQIKFLGYPKVSQILIRHMLQISEIVLGPGHVLYRFFRNLLQDCHIEDVIIKGSKICYDTINSLVGPINDTALQCRWAYIRCLYAFDVQHHDIVCQSQELVRHSEIFGDEDIMGDSKRLYASIIRKRGEIDQAIAIMSKTTSALFQDTILSSAAMKVVLMAAASQADMTMIKFENESKMPPEIYAQSELLLKTAVEKSIPDRGPEDQVTVNLVQTLARFYELFGSSVDAQAQFDYIEAQLERFKLSPDE